MFRTALPHRNDDPSGRLVMDTPPLALAHGSPAEHIPPRLLRGLAGGCLTRPALWTSQQSSDAEGTIAVISLFSCGAPHLETHPGVEGGDVMPLPEDKGYYAGPKRICLFLWRKVHHAWDDDACHKQCFGRTVESVSVNVPELGPS